MPTFFLFLQKKKESKKKSIIFNETGIYSTEGRIYALLNYYEPNRRIIIFNNRIIDKINNAQISDRRELI